MEYSQWCGGRRLPGSAGGQGAPDQQSAPQAEAIDAPRDTSTRSRRCATAPWPVRNHGMDFLGIPYQLPRDCEDRFAGHDLLRFREPSPSDHALRIQQEESPPRCCLGGMRANLTEGQDAVPPNHLQVWMVTEERVRQLQRIRKGLLDEGMVGTDPENLDIESLKRFVIGLPGREVGRSRRVFGRDPPADVEFAENPLLLAVLAQRNSLARRAGEREFRRLLPDLQGGGEAAADQHADQQPTQHHHVSRVFP
jgi:hypothetical protein